MKLLRTGFYREMPHGEKENPSIREYIESTIEDNLKEKICGYLNSGLVLMACGGTVNDVISEDIITIGCPDILTDGKWVWPGDLAYYVEYYDIGLNPEFVSYMKQKEYKIDISLEDIDFDNLEI